MVILFTSVSVKRADHYTRDPSHSKKWKPLSRHYYQTDCLPEYRPIKIKISSGTRPFHSLLLILFLRLMFGMNRGLWSNLHHPEAWNQELRETDSGEVIANLAIDQQFDLDLCLLIPTFSVFLYWRKERYGSLSFEIEIQSLQFFACPEAGAPICQKQWSFHCKKIGL